MPLNNMRKINLAIFILGVLLTVFGFFLSKTDDYPFVLKIVSSAYVKGMQGIRTLESRKDLKPGMVGFKEIAIPLSKRLKNSETNEEMIGCQIKIIRWPTSFGQGWGPSGAKTERKVKAECYDGTSVNTTMESLTKNVEKLKARNLKWYSLGIFLIGLFLSFISFFSEKKQKA